MSDNALHDAFFALHHGLPRQGPGSDSTSRRLLALAGPLPPRPRVLDLGCGPGRSALLLADEAGAQVTAVDLHAPFLDELRDAAEARGLGDTIRTVKADMAELPCPDGSFDLVWAESSAYSIGFDTALRQWRRLLAPGGSLVLTECEWTAGDPSAEARAFWDQHYALRTSAENISAAVAAGYTVLGVHRQPESDWEEYYGPLGERADAADASAPGMAQALAATRAEIAMRRDHGTEYGYTGYVLRPADPRWRTRPETAADIPAVRAVNAAAFPTAEEAGLVEELRRDGDAWLPGMSYVAEAAAARSRRTHCSPAAMSGTSPRWRWLRSRWLPSTSGAARGRRSSGPCSIWRGFARSGSSWSSGIPGTTRGSASSRLLGTESGQLSRCPTRPCWPLCWTLHGACLRARSAIRRRSVSDDFW